MHRSLRGTLSWQTALRVGLVLLACAAILQTGCSRKETPEERITRLSDLVRSRDTKDADKATRELVEIGQPAVDALVVLLNAPEPLARGRAADALGQIGDPRAAEPLLESFCVGRGSVAGLHALAGLDESRAVEAACLVLETGDVGYQQSREAATQVLQDASAGALIQGLGAESDAVVATVADILSGMGPEVVVALVDGTSHDEAAVRLESLRLLTDLGLPQAEQAAVALLADSDTMVADSAVQALAVVLDDVDDTAVAERLAGTTDRLTPFLSREGGTRIAAAWLLARSGDPQAADALYAYRDDPEEALRYAAMWALTAQKDARAAEVLVGELVSNPGSHLEHFIGQSLRSLGPEAAGSLLPVLESEDARVRAQAAEALGAVGDVTHVESLVPLLADEEENVRVSAVRALGEIGDAVVVDPLIGALEDSSDRVCDAAAAALISMDDAQVSRLLEALRSRDLALLAQAHVYYIARGEPGTEDALVAALQEHGTQGMALDYLRSENEVLEQAARAWASEHGYAVVSLPGIGSDAVTWGNAN